MPSPSFVNIVSFFYPIGNTPAVCLTQDLPYEEKANILLLGCGDARNILFTTYSDTKFGKLVLQEVGRFADDEQNVGLTSPAAILSQLL
jgi:hypothetical protein